MRLLRVIFCLCLHVAVMSAQTAPAGKRVAVLAETQSGQARLQLTTSIVEQRQTVEHNVSFLRWTLRFTYTNTGEQPILLDKKSSTIFRSMISRSPKAAAAKRYIKNASYSFVDLRKAGIRDSEFPREDAFVTLKPGESYSVEKEGFGEPIYDGTKDGEDHLHPGQYYLQLKVTTWYYLVPPDAYREQWRDKGHLWSRDVISEPMPFVVDKKRT